MMSMASTGASAGSASGSGARWVGSRADRDHSQRKRSRQSSPPPEKQNDISYGAVVFLEIGPASGDEGKVASSVAAGIGSVADDKTSAIWCQSKTNLNERRPGAIVFKKFERSGFVNRVDPKITHKGLEPDRPTQNFARSACKAVEIAISHSGMSVDQVEDKILNTTFSSLAVFKKPKGGTTYYVFKRPDASAVIATLNGNEKMESGRTPKCSANCKEMNTNGLLEVVLMYQPDDKKVPPSPFRSQRRLLLKLAKPTTGKGGFCSSVKAWISNKIGAYRHGAKFCQNKACKQARKDADEY